MPPIPIVRAKGTLLYSEDGQTYIDAISSWWVNLHGHAHPYIAEKINETLTKIDHVMFAGFTHEGAVSLAERLLPILPGKMARLFYSDNGSTAVEVALKIAIQNFYNRGETKRKKIIAFRNSYHGDTFGAMAVAERSLFTRPFFSYLFDVDFIDTPNEQKSASEILSEFHSLVEEGDVAAFIYEPLVQGAGGMEIYPAEFLDDLLGIAEEHGIIKIADEVMTGFGRTGKLFAHEYLSHEPDIIALSKGITGGVLPLGATATTAEIYNSFFDEDPAKAFYHGHSYTANPVILAAANASLDLVEKPEFMQNVQRIEKQHKAFVEKLKAHPRTKRVRMQGTILAFDINTVEENSYLNPVRDKLYPFFLKNGVLLRPLGNVFYILPPVTITDEELEKVYAVIIEGLNLLE